jgi:hypothetical protein
MHQFFNEEQDRAFLDRVRTALGSTDIEVLTPAAYLLGYIFRVRSDFPDEFFVFFQIIGTLLQVPTVERVYPNLLIAFGEMLSKVTSASRIPADDVLLKQGLLDPFPSFASLDVDTTNKEEVFWVNELFEGIIVVQLAYFKVSYPAVRSGSVVQLQGVQKERDWLIQLSRLATHTLKLPVIRDQLLERFCTLARQSAERCSRRNNVVLNLAPVHKLLALCCQATRPASLQQLGKTTAEFLKTR